MGTELLENGNGRYHIRKTNFQIRINQNNCILWKYNASVWPGLNRLRMGPAGGD
jgi:hypothetical protein